MGALADVAEAALIDELQFESHERVGALGGTFDPLHRAHLHLADAAAQALQLDRLILIPAGDPWRKRNRSVTPAKHRLAMARAAVEERRGGLEVSDIEIRREGPTYTLDTVRELRDRGAKQLWWIMGADAVLDLPHWHQPNEILTCARIAAAVRPGAELDRRELDRIVYGLGRWLDWVPMEPIDLSASQLRARLRRGEDVSSDVPLAAMRYAR
ncbi:MAG: nicotinate-nucleotide adenylyltransferase, partial [Chloroflexi bacterium]|nr:nicotinate-nucleotide adenylyltransferase [Chloroflexota bacterium]